MDFINNWQTALTAPLVAGSGMVLPVPPDQRARLSAGTYLLTLSDTDQQVEIIECDGTQGAVIARGLEGTQERSWPADSVIYAAVTAGQLTGMQAAIVQLQSSIQSLQEQLDGCCAGGGGEDESDVLVDQSGNELTDQNGNTLVVQRQGDAGSNEEGLTDLSGNILTNQNGDTLEA